jgi:adenylate kinase
MDGFPRNLIQAKAFDEMVAGDGGIDLVPLISLEDEEAVRRMTGRRICRTCGAVYHVDFNPPKQEGVCDIDGGELYQRDDDKPETVRNRLFVYYKQTSPLIGYYFAKELLSEVDGKQPIEEVHQKLLSLLQEKNVIG